MQKKSDVSDPSDAIQTIDLYGVRTNNLKNFTCHIPMNRMTILTGVSGSGKSSLAFDTLYAEGQRRFLESMSAYVRMFLHEMPKPPVDRVEHCLPAIALRQQSSFDHPRSTVCTVTEMLLHIAQLYSVFGEQKCIKCGNRVASDTPAEIARRLNAFGRRLKIVLYAEVKLCEGETAAQRLSALAAGGYQRLWMDEKVVELSDANPEILLDAKAFYVLVDRLIYNPEKGIEGRFSEALEDAFDLGGNCAHVDILDPDSTIHLTFDKRLTCRHCGTVHPKLRPESFDPNSTLGACPMCTGFGMVSGIDWSRVFLPHLSLEADAVIPFRTPRTYDRKFKLLSFCKRQKIPTHVPISSLSTEQLELIKFGKAPFLGVNGYFTHLMAHSNKFTSRIQLARFRGYTPCPECHSSGIGETARHVFIADKTIADVLPMTVAQARAFFESLDAHAIEAAGVKSSLEAILLRLRTLEGVGLDYLTLNRRSKTLSGGEAQRLYLSCGLGRGLSDTLYVLDEPTAGLHPNDTKKLIDVMKSLQKMGNTLVVVEHDTDVIQSADHVVELGPCGGENGGHIIFEGNVAALVKSDTPTGKMLRSPRRNFSAETLLTPASQWISIAHATLHNLNDVSIDIPCKKFVAIAGVSGSGKSTLIHEVLYHHWLVTYAKHDDTDDENTDDAILPVAQAMIRGLDAFDDVIMMEQGALGRSTRACVATMTKAFTAIRTLFAEQPLARKRLMTAGTFSFNSPVGACQTCSGLGTKTIEMMFLNDLTIPCPTCHGKRFQQEVLDVTFNDKNIADILSMTVDEAADFFKAYRGIHKTLHTLSDVGLGYIRLGQSTSTLSGGEFQRLRLSTYLDTDNAEMAKTLFIFDEPTVGLHMQDVACLLHALDRLVEKGASVLVIEHNLDLIAHADYVIELGPGGGPKGGNIIFKGTPKDLARADTPTGRALKN